MIQGPQIVSQPRWMSLRLHDLLFTLKHWQMRPTQHQFQGHWSVSGSSISATAALIGGAFMDRLARCKSTQRLIESCGGVAVNSFKDFPHYGHTGTLQVVVGAQETDRFRSRCFLVAPSLRIGFAGRISWSKNMSTPRPIGLDGLRVCCMLLFESLRPLNY